VLEHKQGIKGNSLRATRSTGWCILSALGISALRFAREKQIKGFTRIKKMALIVPMNPEWKDLSEAWFVRHHISRKVHRSFVGRLSLCQGPRSSG
jgi:predicted GIY-YIG superfamily endonuclease